MNIEKKPKYQRQLISILSFIAKDKKSAALKFERTLDYQIQGLIRFPYKFRKSYYFDDEAYRDLIHIGYTVIYKVDHDKILILEIFKWQDR